MKNVTKRLSGHIILAPVQADPYPGKRPEGTISWVEHFNAWEQYHKRFCNHQSALRIAERGGFGYQELVDLLGHEPKTWKPKKSIGK